MAILFHGLGIGNDCITYCGRPVYPANIMDTNIGNKPE
jgi:hypothetical protein